MSVSIRVSGVTSDHEVVLLDGVRVGRFTRTITEVHGEHDTVVRRRYSDGPPSRRWDEFVGWVDEAHGTKIGIEHAPAFVMAARIVGQGPVCRHEGCLGRMRPMAFKDCNCDCWPPCWHCVETRVECLSCGRVEA